MTPHKFELLASCSRCSDEYVCDESCIEKAKCDEARDTLQRYGYVSAMDLTKRPLPDPLIEGVIDLGCFAVVYGREGVGKTLLALDIAASIATGIPWCGRPVVPGHVLYAPAETDAFLGRRIELICRRGVGLDLNKLGILEEPINLANEDASGELGRAMRFRGVRLLIVDTWAKAGVGVEENSAREVGLMIRGVDLIRRESGATVLVTHHTGWNGTHLRGSSALLAAVDISLKVTRDGQAVTLRGEKRRNGLPLEPMSFRVNVEAGIPYLGPSRGGPKLTDAERAILQLGPHVFGPKGARFTDLRTASELPKTTLRRVLTSLVGQGSLRHEGEERDSRYFLEAGPVGSLGPQRATEGHGPEWSEGAIEGPPYEGDPDPGSHAEALP